MDLRKMTIETDRLLLVPISPKYRQEIFEAFTDRVTMGTYPQPTGDISDTDRFISDSSESMRRGEELQFVATLRETGEFIGCTGLHHLWTRPEPGIWLKESAWKSGYGYEIVAALKWWADMHIEYEYLYYPVHKDNVPSRRIPEKLGGVLEAEEFVSKNARGEDHILVAYRIYRA